MSRERKDPAPSTTPLTPLYVHPLSTGLLASVASGLQTSRIKCPFIHCVATFSLHATTLHIGARKAYDTGDRVERRKKIHLAGTSYYYFFIFPSIFAFFNLTWRLQHIPQLLRPIHSRAHFLLHRPMVPRRPPLALATSANSGRNASHPCGHSPSSLTSTVAPSPIASPVRHRMDMLVEVCLVYLLQLLITTYLSLQMPPQDSTTTSTISKATTSCCSLASQDTVCKVIDLPLRRSSLCFFDLHLQPDTFCPPFLNDT